MEEQKKRDTFNKKETKDYSKKNPDDMDFSKMTASVIVEHLVKKTGSNIKFDVDLKNKKGLIKKANNLLLQIKNKRPIDVSGMKSSDIIKFVKREFGIYYTPTSWRKQIIDDLKKAGLNVTFTK